MKLLLKALCNSGMLIYCNTVEYFDYLFFPLEYFIKVGNLLYLTTKFQPLSQTTLLRYFFARLSS